jgi:CheY-like chemotaxis protein
VPSEVAGPEIVSSEPLAGRNILVVEDQMMLVRMMEGMLRDLGCTSISAVATVPEALALADAVVFDAVALDVNLNGTMSFPVADALAAKGVPFMFVTGYSDSGIPPAYQDRPVLRKPYRFAEAMEAFALLVPPSPGSQAPA